MVHRQEAEQFKFLQRQCHIFSIHADQVGQVTHHLSQGVSPEELLRMVLCSFDLETLESVPVSYRCYCSRERMRSALASMGKEELRALIAEQGRAEMTCQFCDAVHVFEKEELEALADSL